jgi:hypothetical protein
MIACGPEQPAVSDAPFNIDLPAPEVLVSLESEMIGLPAGISVDGSGRIWVADSRSSSLLVFDADGTLARTIGREGEGPGEFQTPVMVVLTDTLIRVLDSGNGRVQDYRPDGSHITDHVVASSMLGAGAVSADGRVIIPTMGVDSALAVVRTLGDTGGVRLGPTVAPAPPGFHMSAMKAVIADGGVPDEFRNQATPVAGGGGTTYLLVQTESEIRKYAPDGSGIWATDMAVDEVEAARREFFRKNAEETNPARIYALTTMESAVEVGGDLWVLMAGEAGTPTVLYILDAGTGNRRGRLAVETPAPANRFAIDRERRRLYLAIRDEASILAVDLSGVERVLRPAS